jgi:hypothetical protein
VGREEVEHLGKAAGREAVAAADARALLELDGSARPCLASISFATWSDFSRLTGPPRLARRSPGRSGWRCSCSSREGATREDLRKRARLAVNVDRLQARGHGSGRDLALDAAAGPLDECGDQLAGILQAHRGSWFRLMRPRPFGPRARNWLIASGVIGVCFSADSTLLPRRTALMVLKFTASAEFSAS